MSALKAMVVEDSLPNQNILNMTLQRMGFEVESFNNGAEAWKRLEEQPEGWAFILSDYMMPEMDGLELLKKVRADERFKALPFYLITAIADKTVVLDAKNSGVSGYVVKPISYPKILAKIQPLYPDKRFPQPA